MPTDVDHPLPGVGGTLVLHTADGAPYVICRCPEAYVNPTAAASHHKILTSCEDTNATLRLNLGQSLLTRTNGLGTLVFWIGRFADMVLVEWWEAWGMALYNDHVPVAWKRTMTRLVWKLYLNCHSTLLGKRTGLHPSQSLEYHALTTALFPSKFLAWTPRRMRFFLKELRSSAVTEPPPVNRVDVVEETLTGITIPREQKDYGTVQGWYIHRTTKKDKHKQNKGVIFWIYGGAYLSGDVQGNAPSADAMCQATGCDAVFVPEFRLAPEANLFDVLWDLCLALYWLQQKCNNEQPLYLVGVSSGAALATRLLQMIAQQSRNESLDVPDYFVPLVSKINMKSMGGAVLFGPYVDYKQLYEHERKGSFLHYAQHDLIVNEVCYS